MTNGRCPTTPARTVSPDFGRAHGPGPIYPIISNDGGEHGTLTFPYPPRPDSIFAGSDFGGGKILWIGAPTYSRPVLIRGGQLDGHNPVEFSGGGSPPLAELQFPPGPPPNVSGHGWRNWPSETRLRAAGCYAWQIDGTTFSYAIAFRGVITN